VSNVATTDAMTGETIAKIAGIAADHSPGRRRRVATGT
jgi:hypothetical protein